MWSNVQERINRAVNKARSSLMGAISSVLKDSGEVYVRFSDDNEVRDIKITPPYGFYSLPNNEMLAQIVFNNTDKKASLVGVYDTNEKPVQIDIGEVLLYNPNGGNFIHLKNNGDIVLKGSNIYLN
jgi:phage gp45-like